MTDGDIFPSNPPFGAGIGVGDTYATCLLTFPNVDWFKWNIAGAINQMTLEENWSEDGDVAISFAVEESQKTLEGMIFMAFNPIPIGLIHPYGGAATPDGYLPCDGSSYSSTDYPELFAVLGYVFGGAAGTFNVPDMRDRTGVGTGTTFAAGDTGGEMTHVLDVSEIPAHSHTIPATITSLVVAPGEITALTPVPLVSTVTGDTGGGSGHNNMQPYIALNYVIYAGR
jgi:microcystin-dependent protein